MQSAGTGLVIAVLVLSSSLISLRLRISVAIVEITLGVLAGHLGLSAPGWMLYLGGFGGIVLTFLAGTEIDTDLMRDRLRESLLIGGLSFGLPFGGVFLYAHLAAHWTLRASLIAGTALSTTSLAVVYSVLVEGGLSETEIGKLLMAATFVTDMGTALALSILFAKPTLFTLVFVIASIIVIYLAANFSHLVLENARWKNRVIEPEIKYIFVLLFVFAYLADVGGGHAVLPAFLLGLFMSKHFARTAETKAIRNRLRTVAYAVITPAFFVLGGLKVSLPLLRPVLGLFVLLFVLKVATKFLGVYFLAKRFVPGGSMYATLLMSTGLTFGTISSVFGLNLGIIDQVQYSVLVGVVIASAVIPTFVAQRWFLPPHQEDVLDSNGRDTAG